MEKDHNIKVVKKWAIEKRTVNRDGQHTRSRVETNSKDSLCVKFIMCIKQLGIQLESDPNTASINTVNRCC